MGLSVVEMIMVVVMSGVIDEGNEQKKKRFSSK